MSRELEKLSRELREFLEKLVAKLGVNITAELVARTPVRTGWARANWVPQATVRALGTVGTSQSVSAARQSTGIATLIASYRLSQGPVFITNNVPYILKLNDGTSPQAPSGFIQASIARGISITR